MARILFVCDKIKNGGASKMLMWVAGVLAKENDVDVCYLESFNSEMKSSHVKVFQLERCTQKSNFISRNTFGLFRNAINLLKVIKKEHYDLVVSFGDHSVYPLIIAKRLHNFRLLISERVDPFTSRGVTERIRRSLYRKADFMVFQTQQAAAYFRSWKNIKSIVIPNPAVGTVAGKWKYKDEAKYIISVGRIDIFQKRQDILLEAFKMVLKSYPSYKLRIVGNGDDNQKLIALINKMGLADSVEFLGYKPHKDINELMRNAHLFILSSDLEGIPNVIIEALQMQMPIVSTDCSPGGASLLLDKGKYGIVVKRGDAGALCQGILQALSSKENLISMGNATIGALDRFSEDIIGIKWKEWIKQCVR